MSTIEDDIRKIKERNKRVEADKSWETSWTRRILITVFTYITIVIFFLIMKLPDPFVNALVPSIAFVLSTLVMSYFKKTWLKKHRKQGLTAQ